MSRHVEKAAATPVAAVVEPAGQSRSGFRAARHAAVLAVLCSTLVGAAGTPAAFASSEAPRQDLDSFLCYEVKTQGFDEVRDVHIADAFNHLDYDVTESRELCVPAARICGCTEECGLGEIHDAQTHLQRYKLKPKDAGAEFMPQDVLVTTCLGTVQVDAYSSDKLMVPATKDLRDDEPSPPRPESHGVDHVHCYDVDLSAGAELPDDLQITLEDQFTGRPKRFDVQEVEHLCVAADKNYEGVNNRANALLCYKIKPAKGQKKHKKVKKIYTADQFRTLRHQTKDENEVCLPASICTAATCDDDNACTTDTCDLLRGCVSTPLDCDDRNACTVDTCDSVRGCVSTPLGCDDHNACTVDTCNFVRGCIYTPRDCDDRNACTVDTCEDFGACVSTPLACDDHNACTVDTCDFVRGCIYTPRDCDDHNACTVDTCDSVRGCIYTP